MPQCHSGHQEWSVQWVERYRARAIKEPSMELKWVVYSTRNKRQQIQTFKARSAMQGRAIDLAARRQKTAVLAAIHPSILPGHILPFNYFGGSFGMFRPQLI